VRATGPGARSLVWVPTGLPPIARLPASAVGTAAASISNISGWLVPNHAGRAHGGRGGVLSSSRPKKPLVLGRPGVTWEAPPLAARHLRTALPCPTQLMHVVYMLVGTCAVVIVGAVTSPEPSLNPFCISLVLRELTAPLVSTGAARGPRQALRGRFVGAAVRPFWPLPAASLSARLGCQSWGILVRAGSGRADTAEGAEWGLLRSRLMRRTRLYGRRLHAWWPAPHALRLMTFHHAAAAVAASRPFTGAGGGGASEHAPYP
jgi:hypothetical protein